MSRKPASKRTRRADSRILLGREATETAFKAQPISQYRVIHNGRVPAG